MKTKKKIKKEKKKKWKKNSLDTNREKHLGGLRILTKKMILVRILDEFENGLCDRRLGGHNVASRFVCVFCTPLFDCNMRTL